ncbi:MAG: sulfur carrier protein ThiS [Oscillospiraceae bacterium]|nr:sulfur carrier protein ThiS [Oscillospiraceae bacterium]
MIKINGESIPDAEKKTVMQYLTDTGYDPKRVAVEMNGDILPKSQYESTALQDGDSIEIVSFVGGG